MSADADVQAAKAAYAFALQEGAVHGDALRHALDAVEPGIVARAKAEALREAADAMSVAEPSAKFASGWLAAELGLRARASTYGP